jgi:diphthamide synthase subunit DPH2
MTKKYNINIIVDGALGQGRYTVARRIEELVENDEKFKMFNITVKVTTTDNIDLEKETSDD